MYNHDFVFITCCTLSNTTLSLAMSLESTSKQNSMSEEDTVSREWDGRNMRWKRFFPTWEEDKTSPVLFVSFSKTFLKEISVSVNPEYFKYLTSASLRFSGLTLTLLEMDSRTSAVLEFSLLTLTKNWDTHIHKRLESGLHEGYLYIFSKQSKFNFCITFLFDTEWYDCLSGDWKPVILSYLDGLFMRFLSKVENWKHLLFLGQGHRQVEERIKGDRHLKKKRGK